MYAAFIAFCLMTTPVNKCNHDTAQHWVVAPEAQMFITSCQLHGMEYAATSNLKDKNNYPKVFCRLDGNKPQNVI